VRHKFLNLLINLNFMYNFKDVEDYVTNLWKNHDKEIKESLQYNPKKKLFSFLEGPPTANAPPALHHVEVRVFKDLFCRFKNMQGYTVPRKGGWDCHGLPVEVQIEKALKLNSKKEIINYGIDKFNQKCRESVFSYINDWNKLTDKMAYWIDLEKPYVTLDNNYIESVWWSLKELHKKGLLYEGHKVVPLCPRCETPLSSHEVALGYKEVHDPAIYIKFKIKNKENRYLLIFTTTPWTLYSNVAAAIKKNASYAVVKQGDEEYILAENLVSKHFENPKIIEKIKGEKLIGLEYEPLFPNFKDAKPAFKVISADFVSLEDGTGIVHLASAFGEDDYLVCKEHNIAFLQPVNTNGKFTNEVPEFEGRFVKDCDQEIIELLDVNNKLFKSEKILHSYPFCWRCSTPLLYYATKSWFINVTKFKDKLIKNNQKINWYPETIKEGRFGDWLNNVKDWALSRSKFWGTPLPIWRCSCGNELAIGSVKELKELGKNVSKVLDLHKPFVDEIKIKCTKCNKDMTRVPDVIDCWYDSGSAIFAQWHYPFKNKEIFKKSFPYDFIAEAIDQTRGWFYTLHVLGVMLFDNLAYKNVVCAGHVVDEKGEKMSKSKGNVLNPWEVFDKVGVDAVRMMFCYTEPGEQKRFGVSMINDSINPYLNILWNCVSLYNNLDNFKKTKLEIEDKWLISKANQLIKDFTADLESHKYNKCMQAMQKFVNEDLSRGYIKFVRDRISENDGNVGYTMQYIFGIIPKLLAPFAPYIGEYLYQTLKIEKDNNLVHLSSWPKHNEKLIDSNLITIMNIASEIIQAGFALRDKEKIGVRWPLRSASVYIYENVIGEKRSEELLQDLEKLSELIKKQLNVKEVMLKVKKKSLDDKFNGVIFSIGEIEFDTKINKELEEEGFAREIMRRVQSLRKEAGLKKENKIELMIKIDVDLNKWKKQIMERTGAGKIEFKVTGEMRHKASGKIKEKDFEIGFNLI